MARSAWVISLGVTALLLLSGPSAVAKANYGRTRWNATVSGPGMARPIHLHGKLVTCGGAISSESPLDSSSFIDNTGLLAPFVDGSGPSAGTPPRGPLGPVYRVVTTFRIDGRPVTVHQELYPYGPSTVSFLRSEAWLYTPPGQRLRHQAVSAGWVSALGLFDVLVDHGLPRVAPVLRASQPEAGASSPLPMGLAAGALLGLVAVLATLKLRARHRRALSDAVLRT